MINDAAIRAVYARAETQRDIRNRFNLTLQLDPRYSAIVWAIIGLILNTPINPADGRACVYAPTTLRHRLVEWWAAAFRDMPLDQFRGLLDELCGLGVLLRVDGGYRLRSPNVIDLLGDPDEIEERLYELEQKPAPRQRDFDCHREMLQKTPRRSPLTYAQGRRLVRPQFGVGLVFGSPALGWLDLRRAVDQLVPPRSGQDRVLEEVTVTEADPTAWEEWLRAFLDANRQQARLVLLAALPADVSQCEPMIRASIEFCRRRERSESQWMRILFAFDPAATWGWHLLENTVRTDLENSVAAAVTLNRWDLDAIELHLNSLTPERLVIPDVVNHLKIVTGGWPLLLDEVFTRCGDAHDPCPAAESVRADLERTSPLRDSFLRSLGIQAVPFADRLRAALRQLGTDEFDQDLLNMALQDEELASISPARLLGYLQQLQMVERSGAAFRVGRQVAQVVKDA